MTSVVLAIDTSGSFCSLALQDKDAIATEISSSGEGDHFEQLPRLVQQLCLAASIALSDIDQIRIGTGPGSFTGLRIGLSFAKGLASSLRIGLVGAPSFDGMAAAALQGDATSKRVVVLSDARRDEVFAAIYKRGVNGELLTVEKSQIVPISSLLEPPWSTLEQGGDAWYSPLRDFVLPAIALRPMGAAARGLLALELPKEPFSLGAIAALEPIYIREVAAKTIEERRLGA